MFSKILNLFKNKKPDLTSNFKGIPPKDLTWDDASKFIANDHQSFSFAKHIDNCPICQKKLIEHRSDYNESIAQYMVFGIYCTEGHFTFIEIA